MTTGIELLLKRQPTIGGVLEAEKFKARKGRTLLAEWLLASSNFDMDDWALRVRNFVEDECAQEDAVAPSALNVGLDLPDIKWLHSPHYHCKNCGAEMKYLGRANWKGAGGGLPQSACAATARWF